MPIKRECEYAECPVEAAMDLIGGKWKTMTIALLMTEPLRFNELQRRLKGVTHRVLSMQLSDLEETGLVSRRVIPDNPPKVEYSLTELGRSLQPVIAELQKWGRQFALKRTSSASPSENAYANDHNVPGE